MTRLMPVNMPETSGAARAVASPIPELPPITTTDGRASIGSPPLPILDRHMTGPELSLDLVEHTELVHDETARTRVPVQVLDHDVALDRPGDAGQIDRGLHRRDIATPKGATTTRRREVGEDRVDGLDASDRSCVPPSRRPVIRIALSAPDAYRILDGHGATLRR